MEKTIELKVDGMTCGGCEQSVKRALEQITGVLAVTADHAAGRVVVDAQGGVERDVLASAIEDAGYEVVPDEQKRLPLV